MNRAQALLAVLRGEVDSVDAGTDHLMVLGKRREAREAAARALRAQADQRHPELTVAQRRRRRAAAS